MHLLTREMTCFVASSRRRARAVPPPPRGAAATNTCGGRRGGTKRGKRGFGMTCVRVTHTRVAGAWNEERWRVPSRHRGDTRACAAAAAAGAACARGGSQGGTTRGKRGFGMTRTRVTRARDTGARDDARLCIIEATRARMSPPRAIERASERRRRRSARA